MTSQQSGFEVSSGVAAHQRVPQHRVVHLALGRRAGLEDLHDNMRFGSTAKVLAKCRLEYYSISECIAISPDQSPALWKIA